jgi:hypothetical protein
VTRPSDVDRLLADHKTDGKSATAPCGHPGVHVTRSYVQCSRGCDRYATSQDNARAKTEPGHGKAQAPITGQCQHPATTLLSGGRQQCKYCHVVLKPASKPKCQHKGEIEVWDFYSHAAAIRCIACNAFLRWK